MSFRGQVKEENIEYLIGRTGTLVAAGSYPILHREKGGVRLKESALQ